MKVSCLNCSQHYEGKFCPQCGQKASTHRITFMAVLHDIPHSVWHVDKGFVYTFIQLLKRPGKAIKEFVEGKRVQHYPPFAYLFILSAASSLVSHLKAFYFKEIKEINLGINPDLPFKDAAIFFDKYPALMFCLLIPFTSLWTWLFNKKSGNNYWENLVLNTYLVSQFNLFFICNDLVTMFAGAVGTSMVPMLAVFFFYNAIGYSQFFPKDNSAAGIAKRAMMYIVIVFTVITGLSLAGFMTPWWGM